VSLRADGMKSTALPVPFVRRAHQHPHGPPRPRRPDRSRAPARSRTVRVPRQGRSRVDRRGHPHRPRPRADRPPAHRPRPRRRLRRPPAAPTNCPRTTDPKRSPTSSCARQKTGCPRRSRALCAASRTAPASSTPSASLPPAT
jgi:hypothetical protein